MRMSVTRLPPPLLQVLIIKSSDDAGLGNRLQAMVSAFLFAIVSNRVLLIEWAENANQIVRAWFVLFENFTGGRVSVLAYCICSLTTLYRACATAIAHDATWRLLQFSALSSLWLCCRICRPMRSRGCRQSIPFLRRRTRGW